MKKYLFIFILIALTTGIVTADVYIKQKIHTDAINMMDRLPTISPIPFCARCMD